MPPILSKLLVVFGLPLGWAFLLGGAALLLLALGRRRLAGGLVLAQLVVLWVFAMPWTSYQLTAWREAEFPRVALEETPPADVAVVLGGAVGALGNPPSENLNGASDRVLRAARLFRAGKVDHVLAVGGNYWIGEEASEAVLIRDLLVEWGVPRDAVLTEDSSRNTRENATLAAEIIRREGWTRVLLVTSASHMRRAVREFQAAGVDVIPSATDYSIVGPASFGPLDFLPDAGSLGATSSAVREVLGRAVQQLRGAGG
jgi:uncharacterized SAM-binding protein YcdF (DUF218 family)